MASRLHIKNKEIFVIQYKMLNCILFETGAPEKMNTRKKENKFQNSHKRRSPTLKSRHFISLFIVSVISFISLSPRFVFFRGAQQDVCILPSLSTLNTLPFTSSGGNEIRRSVKTGGKTSTSLGSAHAQLDLCAINFRDTWPRWRHWHALNWQVPPCRAAAAECSSVLWKTSWQLLFLS